MNRRMLFVVVMLSLGALALNAATAAAAVIQLDAVDSGAYQNNGFHGASNQNYVTGQSPLIGTNRSFFVFDLTGVTGAITGATLNLFNPDPGHPCCVGYRSPEPTETFALYDVSTPVDTLVLGGAGQVGTFDDLGTGSLLGEYVASPDDNGKTAAIVFNAAGLAALNAAIGGTIAFGGALTSLDGPAEQLFFAFTMTSFAGDDVRRLDLTTTDLAQVPEPTSLALLGLGLVGVGARLRRRVASRQD